MLSAKSQTGGISRRGLISGGLIGVPTLGLVAGRPAATGGPHSEYFLQVQAALKEAGLYRPTLVIDKARLAKNIDWLKATLPANKAYRVVAKSLPALGLIDTVLNGTGSNRVMLFHQPFLNHIAKRRPDSDVLMGKPMPVGAAKRFYDHHQGAEFQPSEQLQWLVDSMERLTQYAQLAASGAASGQIDGPLRINLEIDVGLHRGGFNTAEAVAAAVQVIRDHPNLEFSGLMGYEPHIVKIPGFLGGPETALKKATDFYQSCISAARAVLGDLWQDDQFTLNTGGSQTIALYDEQAPANELAMGSGLVKPTDFDLPTLDSAIPAAFIATPVIKANHKTQIPGVESASGLLSWLDPNSARTYFIYGGHWYAELESPPGLQENGIYGHSTNHMMINGSEQVQLSQDDFVFLRPQQSEFVFLQFGEMALYDEGKITEMWPVFQQGA